MFVRWLSVAIAASLLIGCGDQHPAGRSLVLAVAGCGDAFDSEVGGVVVGANRVLTVAHAVVQAGAIEVKGPHGALAGHIVAVDRRTDLALVAVDGLEADEVVLGAAAPGDRVVVRSGLASGDVEGEVVEVVDIGIEEALGTNRVERHGLRLRAGLVVGDSGAGVYRDEALVGLVFAVNEDGSDTAWATSAREIEALLGGGEATWTCDPDQSRLVSGQP